MPCFSHIHKCNKTHYSEDIVMHSSVNFQQCVLLFHIYHYIGYKRFPTNSLCLVYINNTICKLFNHCMIFMFDTCDSINSTHRESQVDHIQKSWERLTIWGELGGNIQRTVDVSQTGIKCNCGTWRDIMCGPIMLYIKTIPITL